MVPNTSYESADLGSKFSPYSTDPAAECHYETIANERPKAVLPAAVNVPNPVYQSYGNVEADSTAAETDYAFIKDPQSRPVPSTVHVDEK